MNDIKQLAIQFRNAIDTARDANEFNTDHSFNNFPRGCCGDACDLLAQFLLDHGIKSCYVWGFYHQQSHAWLVANNYIIDITGDQFKSKSDFLNYDKSVYVGQLDDFHKLFKVERRNIRENHGLNFLSNMCNQRLIKLLEKINKYL